MASITKNIGKTGTTYTVRVKKNGERFTATRDTLRAAKEWAAKKESELTGRRLGKIPDKSLSDLMRRYSEEVSIGKRGERAEQIRAKRLMQDVLEDGTLLGDVKLVDLDGEVITDWKNQRLKIVKPSSVNRDLNLLSHAFTVSIREWKWLHKNPVAEITRPKNPKARDRRYSEEHIQLLSDAFHWEPDRKPVTRTERNGVMFRLAIETAMRRGELCGLMWDAIDLERRVAHLSKSKNGDERDVPLSTEAVRLLRQMEGAQSDIEGSVFGMNEADSEALWRKVRDSVGLKGVLTFHDTRHEAITRLSKKLDVLALARMVGHRNIAQLMTYYNETAQELALKLD